MRISSIADWVKELIQTLDQTQSYEIRIIMPKFGVINERTNSLHEVQRLSGINIPVRYEDISLVVKVGTLQPMRLQVYLLDNEYLFQRKGIFKDEEGNFYHDNHDRIIFMNKAVLAILEYLQWIPKLVHCIGWPWALFPMYAKALYKQGTSLAKAKYLYTHDDTQFQPDISGEIFYDTKQEQKSPSLEDFYDMARKHADYTSSFLDQPYEPIDATQDAELDGDADKNSLTNSFVDLYPKLIAAIE